MVVTGENHTETLVCVYHIVHARSFIEAMFVVEGNYFQQPDCSLAEKLIDKLWLLHRWNATQRFTMLSFK